MKWLLVLGAALPSCCSNPPRVVAFDVQPRTACPGDRVYVTWDVVGPARLGTTETVKPVTEEPDSNAWMAHEQDAPSHETRSVKVEKTTWFTIRAVKANQAKERWLGKQPVDVPMGVERRGGLTKCDDAGCSTSFTMHASLKGRVVALGHPQVTESGSNHDAEICVTHDSMQHTCVAAGASLPTSLPVDGEWKLETGAATKPGALWLQLQIACP